MAPRVGPVRLSASPASARALRGGLEAHVAARAAEAARAAYERGLAEGREQALASGAAALEATLERLDAAAERAQEELARDAVELAVEIAQCLLMVRLEAGEYDLERVVRGALSDAEVGRGSVVVHLNPDDHERLADALFRAGTELCVDPDLTRGDVRLTTPRGLLVRETGAALTSIREQLLEELAR
jgi:flagellar biosynthesis/type III secretory pathway protein FliH